ncbi:MAG TPA: hypothetical protein VL574_11625 [Stellaceae bacterium]|jgi:hypothetical protein|nr:hypothetical protein [Stellaceae bacterium]
MIWGYAEHDYYKAAMGAFIAWIGVWGLMTRANPDNVGPIYLRRSYLVFMFWVLLLGAAFGIWDMSLRG